MSEKFTLVTRLAASAVGLILLSQGSQILHGAANTQASLCLTWSAVGAQIDSQTLPTNVENLPVHMRPSESAGRERVAVEYRLTVRVDGREILDEKISASGMRHDRPLCVWRQLELGPGQHRVQIDFSPQAQVTAEEALKTAHFDSSMTFEAGKIRFVRLIAQPQWKLEEQGL